MHILPQKRQLNGGKIIFSTNTLKQLDINRKKHQPQPKPHIIKQKSQNES